MPAYEKQLSLFSVDIKQAASLQDFNAPSFLPILKAVDELLDGSLTELYIYGSDGSGKTHLLTAIYSEYIKRDNNAIFLSFRELLDSDIEALTGLEAFHLIIIDDIHLAHTQEWQEALFHLINRVRTFNGKLIFSANLPVVELPFGFMDLTTRLAQSLNFLMPDGTNIDDRSALIHSILKQKGWLLPESIVDHLLKEGPHLPKDMVSVLTYISSYFTHRNNTKIPKKLLDEVKDAIIEQSFLLELAEFDQDANASYGNNFNLPI